MNKVSLKKKLVLNTETLQPLTSDELAGANGGIIWTVVPVSVALTLLVCAPGKAR